MSSDDPMEEIRASFYVECEELLEALQDGLNLIESGEGDDETINVVFRAVHSIKGGAAAFAMDDLVHFAHGFENGLDVLRNGTVSSSPDIIRVAFKGADYLGDLVNAAKDGTTVDTTLSDALIAEFMAAIGTVEPAATSGTDSLVSNTGPVGFAPQSISFSPAPVGVTELPSLATSSELSNPGWEISFKPHPDLAATGNDARILFRALSKLGDISVKLVATNVPTLDQFDVDESYLEWTVILKADVEKQEVVDNFAFVDGLCDLTIEKIDCDSEISNVPAMLPELTPAESQEESAVLTSSVQPEPQEAKPKAPKTETKVSSAPAPTVRVELERIDRLINQVGELVINQSMLSQSAIAEGLPPHSPLMSGLDEFLRLTRDIQDSVMMIRAQPVKPLFQRMARIIRETSQQVGKDVRLVTEGETTEVDKTVIERLAEPLTHMIRNAVDHGLESPSARKEAGKSLQGSVTLSAAHKSGRVVIELSDDGAGINREKVLSIAVEKGLIDQDAQLSSTEIDNLLFLPGFSTASSVSDLSGRGVGMDVVKTAIQALDGRISISSTPGSGSTFTISLPLTLAVLDGMVVSVENQTLVLPLPTIQETLTLYQSDLLTLGKSTQVIRLRGRFLPVVDLGVELGYRKVCDSYDERIALVIQGDDGTEAALVIDQILEQRQVVIKGLQDGFGRIPGVAAATILGDGRIALILDPVDVINSASGITLTASDILQESA